MNYKIQSVIFNKDKFNKKNSEKWLIDHKYKIKKVDITDNYLRYRQLSPSYIKKQGYDKYRNKDIGNGIILVIAYK
jgi:hypothetical protein